MARGKTQEGAEKKTLLIVEIHARDGEMPDLQSLNLPAFRDWSGIGRL